ncbi:MAG: CorA family divalent cation transporter, partial [Gammaproteobacteria bacterium]
MIRAILYDKASGEIVVGGRELHSQWQQTAESVLWLDLEGEPEETETPFLLETLGLHTLAIQDAQRLRHPPKLESFDDFTFMLLKGLSTEADGLHFSTVQIAIFIGERLMVTRRTGDSPGTET